MADGFMVHLFFDSIIQYYHRARFQGYIPPATERKYGRKWRRKRGRAIRKARRAGASWVEAYR